MTSSSAEKPRKHRFWHYFVSPEPLWEMTPAQQRYDTLSSFPMFFAAMVWLLSTFFTWAPELSPIYRQEGVRLSLITWLIFAIDMVIRFILDPKKGLFFKRNWLLLIALAFPPLRIILVVMAVMRVARDRNALTKIVGIYAVYAVLFVVLFGAVFTLIYEIDAPGANITSYGDSVWWAFVTVTTVGYGDFTPITVGGRVIAVLIMFTGAAAVGAVTAAVASRFITGANAAAKSAPTPSAQTATSAPQDSQATSPAQDTSMEGLARQLTALQAQIDGIAAKLGVSEPATRATDGE